MDHLIAKDKVDEQHILGKHSNCNNVGSYNGFTQQSEFQSSYYSAIQGATGLKLYCVIAYQKVDGQHIRKDFCNSNTFQWTRVQLLD